MTDHSPAGRIKAENKVKAQNRNICPN